jgi:prephenate dehydrogenase
MIGLVRIAIIGMGLIGGSIARALRRSASPDDPGPSVTAWAPRPDGPRAALAAGAVDAAPADLAEAIDGADLIVLAAPPLACLELLDQLGGPLRASLSAEVTVTDVASTKRAIVARADELRLPFVGGHPMAGLETTGFGAARGDLFADRAWIVCRGVGARDADVARVDWLVRACGARAVALDPGRHDALTAVVSHVPLVVSAALVEALTGGDAWPAAADLAAGGWRDMTRLAKGDPTMGAGIAATNAAEVAAGLRAVRAALDGWIAALGLPEPDADALRARFAEARERASRG